MNKPKKLWDYTPGPWKVEEQEIRLQGFDTPLIGYAVTALKHDDLTTIAEIHPKPYRVAVREENARLIAAAPDLLEAAEAVSREWDAYIGERDREGHDDAVLVGERIAALRAAVAKAEGR